MSTGDLTDAQWQRLAPVLPPRRPAKGSKGGRPAEDHRRIVNGLLWLDRSGARWRDIPERYGPWQTLATRFYRWQQQGIWPRILDTLQAHTDAAGQLAWEGHSV